MTHIQNLKIVQLMTKLFCLELKNDDPLALASEVRYIMHEIKKTGVDVDIPPIAYVKELYPTYSHYLESLQESGNLMKITFDSLEKNFVEREKTFRKMTNPQSSKDSFSRFFERKRKKKFQRKGGQTNSN